MTAEETTTELVIEANVDDLDPRLWPGVLDALMAAGAADAWVSPITMKKGRPAHTVHVLCRPDRRDAVHDVIFTQTSTIGVREHEVAKTALARQTRQIDVDGQPVGVKVALRNGRVVNVSVEFDDLRRAAAHLGLAPKDALRRATAAVERLLES
jgi:uncharacterized protein (DUF111 family)